MILKVKHIGWCNLYLVFRQLSVCQNLFEKALFLSMGLGIHQNILGFREADHLIVFETEGLNIFDQFTNIIAVRNSIRKLRPL